MKKINQRGFVLAEAFIVSTFVLAILVFMFLQIKTIINGYDRSFSYNTIPGIYNAREIKKFIQRQDYDSLIESDSDYALLYVTDDNYKGIFEASNVKTVVVSNGDLTSLKTNTDLTPKFQNYIKTLTNSTGYQIIIEFGNDTFAVVEG